MHAPQLAELPLVSSTFYDATYGDIDSLIRTLFEMDASTGGGIIHAGKHTRPTSGYAVGMDSGSLRIKQELTPKIIRAWLDDIARLYLGGPIQHIGIWRDFARDEMFLDVIAIREGFNEAFELAARNGQEAFWDLDEGKAIRLPGAGLI